MTDRRKRSLPFALTPAAFWWCLGGILIAIGIAYTNSFPGAFFFDDEQAIVQNASIRNLFSWHVLWPPVQAGIGGRPFANITFALNYALAGKSFDPAGYHAVNVAIHLAAVAVLFALARRTLLLPSMREQFGRHATWIAALVAALWGLDPLQTNVVDYMSQRTEELMALLYLITLYAYLRSVTSETPLGLALPRGSGVKPTATGAVEPATGDSRRRWTTVAFVACALGMATKEDMVTAPVIALLYDRTFVSGGFTTALRKHGAQLRALGATWVLLAGLMMTSKLSARGVGLSLKNPFTYAITECHSILNYLQLSVWPHPLVFDYGTDFYFGTVEQAIPFVLAMAALLALTVYTLRRAPLVGFALTWFLVLLSPSSSVVPVAQQPCAENRVYLPAVGIIALVVVAAYRTLGRRSLPALAIAAAALGIATHTRNPVFKNELAIWSDTVAKRPTNPRAENNLGNALLKAGRAADAMPHFEQAIKLSPTYADAHNNRGVVLLQLHKPQDALVEFRRAVELKNDYADAWYNIGEAYLEMRQDANAVEPLERSLKLNPNNPKAHNNLGIALLDLGKVPESIEHEQRAVALSPDLPEAHYNLANSLARAKRFEEALAEYDATLRVAPNYARAYNNAGVILLNQGKRAEAREKFEAALRIDPAYPEAKSNLALVQPSTQTAASRP